MWLTLEPSDEITTHSLRTPGLQHVATRQYEVSHMAAEALLELASSTTGAVWVRPVSELGAEVLAIRSITDPELFWKTNVLGTFNLLELARAIKPKLFLYTSSAEVVANRPGGALETDPLDPPNPYAASKAAGEMLVNSYVKSFGVPAITTRTMNLFGEKQQNSKFIPVIIGKIQERSY